MNEESTPPVVRNSPIPFIIALVSVVVSGIIMFRLLGKYGSIPRTVSGSLLIGWFVLSCGSVIPCFWHYINYPKEWGFEDSEK